MVVGLMITSLVLMALSAINLALFFVRRNKEQKRHNETALDWIKKDPLTICLKIKDKAVGINKYQANYAIRENLYSELIRDYQDQIKENEPAMVEKIGKELVEQIKAFEF